MSKNPLKAYMPRYSGGSAQKKAVIISLFAAFVTSLAYLPALRWGFVSIDDPGYVTGNPLIRSIDLRFFGKAFTTVVLHNYHPLTIISYALDYSLWGLNPLGYHLTNIIFHAANTFLVGTLAFRLSSLHEEDGPGDSAVITGAVTALLFGLHPLHVESVAWVAERKDVVCGFFFLLSVLAYIRYASGKTGYYYASLGFFALSLLSKPMAVTLPFVLLILDYYPLGRLRPGAQGLLRSAFEKAPYFILSAALSVVTLFAQRGAMVGLETYGFPTRLAAALKAYIFYIYKMVLPLGLAPYYQRQTGAAFFDLALVASIALLLSITAFCLLTDKKIFKAAWLYYLITLFPVIGLIQVGGQAAADRYTYIPGIAPSILLGAGAGILVKRAGKKVLVAVMAVVLALAALTMRQEAVWKDSLTLWNYEIRLFPGKIKIAYNSRGGVYRELHDYRRALIDLDTAISLDSKYALPYNNRGLVYREIGDYEHALTDFSTSVSLDPNNAFAFINRADTYKDLRDYQKALADYGAAISLDPGNSFFYNQRGLAYSDLGDYARAMEDYNAAINADRQNPLPYNNRGILHAALKEYGPAIKDFSEAISLKPDFSFAYRNRGSANMELGNFNQAIDDFTRASTLNPRDANALLYRGMASLNTGGRDRAIEDFKKALDLNPNLAGAYFYLGVAYLRTGETALASEYLKKASRMGVKEADNFLRKAGGG